MRHFLRYAQSVLKHMRTFRSREASAEHLNELRTMQIKTVDYVIQKLQEELTTMHFPAEQVRTFLYEYQQIQTRLYSSRASVSTLTDSAMQTIEMRRLGLSFELEQIQAMYEADNISRVFAKRLRENVYLMQLDLEEHI